MTYSANFINNLKEAKQTLNQMIENAQKQGAKNFEMLYALDEALDNLLDRVKINNKPSDDFFVKWENIMGWAHRVFEDHPLLDRINAINMEIRAL